MTAPLLTVRCVCGGGHMQVSVTQEGERVVAAEILADRMRDSLANGAFGTACARCGAARDTWRIEVEGR